ncbi:MAG: CotH kinase family protein, partial [Planctomycetia bacterium]|nr:CotH kinase family protein [Planctomycetia bacterium]
MFRAFFAKKADSSVRFGASAITGVRGPGRERRSAARRLLHEPLEPRLTLAAGPLLISEFLALNNIGLKDDNGDRSDWIEIHNPTGAAINLDGYFVTDDADALTKWRFPNVDIAAGGYLLVYASGKDRANPTAPLHTNFKLDGDGEYLALVRPDGATIAHEYAPEFPAQAGDISYGLASSIASGPEAFFGIQTPGETNGVGSPTLSGMLAFSRPGGTFVEPFELTLTTETPGVVIRYTLDRTVPTVTSSLYTAAITISATTMVRASIFVEGKPPSVPVSQTYFALDPALASFDSNLPLVVIDTFGQTVWNVNTDVPFVSSASLFIEPGVDGRAALTDAAAFCGPTGVKCRGWTATVTKRNFEKWNYALETWNEQGDDLAVSLLGLPEESNWVLLGPYTDKTLMRDYLAYKWSSDMGEYAPRTQYFELYRNMDGGTIGQEDYCGVYVLVEKIKPGQNRVDIEKLDPTDNTLPDITGGYIFAKDRTEYESTFTTTHSGTWVNVYPGKNELTVTQKNYLTAYVNEVETVLWGANFADPVNGYAKYIDVDSFIDSFISVELAKNVDGYGLSSYFYKDRNGKLVAGPVWDYNLTMANAWYGGTWNPAGWKYAGSSDTQCPFYNRLFQDPNFVQAVADRWTELRRDILSDERLMQDVDDTAAYLDEAQQRNYERYDDVLGTCVWPEFYIGQTYEDEMDILRMWLHDRLAWIDSQFLAAPQLSQDGGTIDVGGSVTASTPIGTVYYTTDGSDPRLPGGGLSPTAVALGRESSDSVLVPFGANWQYVDNGAYPLADEGKPNWNQLNHDPLNPLGDYGYAWFTVQVPWKYGPAHFGYGDGDETTIVDYGSDPDHKYVTTYFRHGFGLADKSAITGLRLRLLCDDGAVVYLNGSEIARFNMPSGTISNSTKANSEIPDGDESRYRVFVLNPSKLVDGDNLIAVEVHQSSLAGPDISFDLELTATSSGSSGEVAFDENTLLTARAYDGGHWSGLTQAAFVVESPLAITEIMYNPPAPTATELAAGFDDKEQFEFIEITNAGVETVSLAEVRLVDGVTFDFAAGSAATLAPGEFVVVVRDREAFEARYGAGINVAGEYTGGLANSGERIALEYGAGVTVEAVEYGTSGDWPGRADGHGSALERIDTVADIADPANWRSSTEYGGSPGEAGLGPITDVLVNEVLSHTDPPQVDAIELVNTT